MNRKATANIATTYQRTGVLTANREAILLMLYDAAIRNIKGAIEAVNTKDFEKRTRLTGKAQDIVTELRATLNFNVSQELATSLDRLYTFVNQRLFEGTLDGNVKFLNEALNTLETLQKAWEEAVASINKEKKGQSKPK